MTSFNELTFFHADFNQTEVEDSFPLPSDWIKSEQKKSGQTFGLLATIKITVLTFLVNQNYNEAFRGVCFLGIREET